MKPFFTLFFLTLFRLNLPAQPYLIHPLQLDTLRQPDSSWYPSHVAGFRQNARCVGLLNGRFPATLLNDAGLVLVAKVAIQPYTTIDSSSRLVICPAPVELPEVIIRFTDTVQEMPQEMRFDPSGQMVEWQIKSDTLPGLVTAVKSYQQQTRFFAHRYRTTHRVQLLAYTNSPEGADYALLRITGLDLSPPELLSSGYLPASTYAINFPPTTHYHRPAAALTLYLQELEGQLALLEPARTVYRSAGKTLPEKTARLYQQASSTHQYLRASLLTSQRQLTDYRSYNRILPALNEATAALTQECYFYQMGVILEQVVQTARLSVFLGQGSPDLPQLEAFLTDWMNHWEAETDQALFSALLTRYFDESQASYWSTELIEQIRSQEKSFARLGEQIYGESLLAHPQKLLQVARNQGMAVLYQQLEADPGYRFFSRLFQDQQRAVTRPLREQQREWQQLEHDWQQAKMRSYPLPFLDGNHSQRFHFLHQESGFQLPNWDGTAGTPVFDTRHRLAGFLFPVEEPQAGLNWYLPPDANHPYRWCSISDLQLVLQQLPRL